MYVLLSYDIAFDIVDMLKIVDIGVKYTQEPNTINNSRTLNSKKSPNTNSRTPIILAKPLVANDKCLLAQLPPLSPLPSNDLYSLSSFGPSGCVHCHGNKVSTINGGLLFSQKGLL